jgi:hypothetical protein
MFAIQRGFSKHLSRSFSAHHNLIGSCRFTYRLLALQYWSKNITVRYRFLSTYCNNGTRTYWFSVQIIRMPDKNNTQKEIIWSNSSYDDDIDNKEEEYSSHSFWRTDWKSVNRNCRVKYRVFSERSLTFFVRISRINSERIWSLYTSRFVKNMLTRGIVQMRIASVINKTLNAPIHTSAQRWFEKLLSSDVPKGNLFVLLFFDVLLQETYIYIHIYMRTHSSIWMYGYIYMYICKYVCIYMIYECIHIQ